MTLNSLPHNHDFQRPCTKSLLKSLWDKEKLLGTSIFSFSHNVSTLSNSQVKGSVTFILSSANAFNLDQSKILSFGKELNPL